ncbi:MAG: PQQ-binding-like beta-propeller repeat protein [Acidobacteria bacterium]|nr:PQQ-binding-like beta-propeller repeat protein [Acidobacteriota bacterium]MBI3655503.1 PQQ-binding-like beta-propeller repeat protein [Acidobacteriota bacterium]
MKRILIVLLLLLVATAVAEAQPVITSLSADSLPRSGRLLIRGASFGSADRGRVEIGGREAPFTRWSDALIAAYVPEATTIGAAAVQVFTDAGASNTMPLAVTLRTPPQDGVAWRFQADAMYIRARPAVGPDGTVYTNDVAGHLYALAPDGGLQWIFNGAGGSGVTLGPDGNIYAGSEAAITAINPDGTLLWRFAQNPRAFILLGPNVGPDGNIYAVATQGLGVFSLTPYGDLRWSMPEPYSRPIVDLQEIVFGPGDADFQLYFNANDHLKGIRLDGREVFTISGSLSAQLGDPQPAVGPDGNIYTHQFLIGQGTRLVAFDPQGDRLWTFFEAGTNVVSTPDVGQDGVIYDGHNLASLYAIHPNGAERWRYTDSGILSSPVVSPNNDLIFLGGIVTYGQPGLFAGVSTAGALLWRILLPIEDGRNVVPSSRARFSGDAQMVYIGTSIPGQESGNEYCYLYAVATAP